MTEPEYVPGGTGLICEAITSAYCERCPEFVPDCWVCRAWAELDHLVAAPDRIAAFIEMEGWTVVPELSDPKKAKALADLIRRGKR
jgi:hypothetical protein